MTREEYEKYCADFERGTKGLEFLSSGASHNCGECNPEGLTEEEFGHDHDPWFSASPCDICGGLAGNREPAHGWLKMDNGTEELCHIDICVDCVYFMEYGQLDDMTMLDMEEE